MDKRYRRMIDEPVNSDRILLLSVEDLIYTAFGSNKGNRVDFKLLQKVFLILARELRLLQQDVEIKFDDIIEHARENTASFDDSYDDESDTYSSSSAEGEKDERGTERGRKDRARKEKKGDEKVRGKIGDKTELGETGEKKERKDRRGKGEKKDGKTSSKDREGKGRSKDRDEKDKRSRDREKSSGGRRGEDDGDEGFRKRGRRGGDDGDEGDRERGRRGDDDEGEGRRERGRRGEEDGYEGFRERGRRGEDDGDEGFRKWGRRGEDDRDEGRRKRGRRGEHDRGEGRERARRGEDDRDEGGPERGRGREWGGERGADGRGGRGGEREDRDAQRQDRGGLERRDSGRQTSGTSITVSEATRRGSGGRGSADKILVAERGPAARVRPARIGSIEVVTASQFALLGKAVKQLEQITGPQPTPVLPDDETLRQDLAKGRASLQDTMQAVQLNERVQAAEQGLNRLAEVLTQLAQSGMLPPEFAVHVGAMEEYLQAAIAAGYAAAGPDGPGGASGHGAHFNKRMELDASNDYGPDSIVRKASTVSRMGAKKSKATVAAVANTVQGRAAVTRNDVYEVMQHMKEGLLKEVFNLTARADHSAQIASNTSRIIAEKMDIAMQVNERINTLLKQTAEYDLRIKGFDSGVTAQVRNFKERLVEMRNNLAGGLALLDMSNNSAETAALLDLSERHQSLVVKLENTVLLHQNLHITQQQISDEIRNLIQCIEMLHEQKADRKEVHDGLKNKANVSCLVGLLREEVFTNACFDIERRLEKCYEKFSKKDEKWQDALNVLMAIVNNKGENLMLIALKHSTNVQLNAIQKLLNKLEIMLGEPKAAILMRKLAKDATCAACLTRALMEPEDPMYGKPLPLPSLRSPPLGAEQQPCLMDVKLAPTDVRDHTCRRWVGGSHTLMPGNVVKEQAKNMQLQIKPTKKFEGYGSDGRLYMMEKDMQPCEECNQLGTDELAPVSAHPPTPTGAGDQPSGPTRRR